MKAAAGLLLLLLPLCYGDHGVETSCDARQNETKCYGALGGSVVIQLLSETAARFQWFRNAVVILEMFKGRPVVNKLRHGSIISDETVKLENLNQQDDGEYRLAIFNSGGQSLGQRILQLMIQAPVSSVSVTLRCLSQGGTRVSCHSGGGDSPQYRWSLDGVPQNSSEDDPSSITLKRGQSGLVVCNVSNNVSRASAGQTIAECDFINCTLSNGTDVATWLPKDANVKCYEPTTPTTASTGGKETSTTVSNKPSTNITTSSQTTSTTTAAPWYIQHMTVLAAVLSALVFLLVLAVAFICVHKKRHKAQDSAPLDEEHELTYADVKILKGRQAPQVTHQDVEYGQVKVARRSRHIAESKGDGCGSSSSQGGPAPVQDVEYGQVKIARRPRQIAESKEDECVYAKVRAGR